MQQQKQQQAIPIPILIKSVAINIFKYSSFIIYN
jgi:hypothetical protein